MSMLTDDEREEITTLRGGLSSEEAGRRLQRYGPNATADVEPPAWRVLLDKFVAPVPCLLEAAIVLQLLLGEYIEASVIGVLLVFNAALGFFQEGRAKSTLAALKSRLALNASVLRDGAWSIVPAASLVPGDTLKLTLGSVVAADVRIIEGAVQLDQSMLTGESMPVDADPGYQTFAGALVRRGEAVAEVTATGANTRFGRAAELVAHRARDQHPAEGRAPGRRLSCRHQRRTRAAPDRVCLVHRPAVRRDHSPCADCSPRVGAGGAAGDLHAGHRDRRSGAAVCCPPDCRRWTKPLA